MSIDAKIALTGTVIASLGAVIAIITAWVAIKQSVEAVKQNKLSQIAIQAQTFLTIVNTAREIRFSEGMDIIRGFKYKNYKTYRSKETRQTQLHVREVVDFLNDLMHMIEHGYLTEKQVMSIYYVSILACANHLVPWWTEGFREEHGSEYYYITFEDLCNQVKSLGEGYALNWDQEYKLG
ncbi:MAG: hypothetical protein HY863_08885 [Chloroflexi bacterium]|nr:hypothetical protein [Chloroflexota bacterium]